MRSCRCARDRMKTPTHPMRRCRYARRPACLPLSWRALASQAIPFQQAISSASAMRSCSSRRRALGPVRAHRLSRARAPARASYSAHTRPTACSHLRLLSRFVSQASQKGQVPVDGIEPAARRGLCRHAPSPARSRRPSRARFTAHPSTSAHTPATRSHPCVWTARCALLRFRRRRAAPACTARPKRWASSGLRHALCRCTRAAQPASAPHTAHARRVWSSEYVSN